MMRTKPRDRRYYEVEEVLDREYRNNEPYYLIKWKGYPE